MQRYAHICPDRAVLDELVRAGPIVELGAGRGYWSRLLRDLGGDVIAYDNWSWAPASGLWTDIETGNEVSLAAHADRTLLIVKPPRPGTGRMVRAWPGRLLVVVTDGPYPNTKLAGGGERDAMTALAGGRWSLDRTYALSDPVIQGFVGAYYFKTWRRPSESPPHPARRIANTAATGRRTPRP